ncbi:MAG: substrate-binding domain-containing protein [Bacilli bacterium]|nr:substrate-binding domain-containing protein [Bacilli bacterium]
MKNQEKVVCLMSMIAVFALTGCGTTTSSVVSSVASSVSTSSSLTSSSASSVSFDSTKKIIAYTRDTTSGTRDGFFTKIGLAKAKTDNAPLVKGYVEVASNGAMASSIKNDKYGIGYISLASLAASDLNGLPFEGVTPSEANVLNSTYALTRNFNYITRNDYATDSKAGKIVEAFVAFLSTMEAKATIKAADGILSLTGTEPSWASIKANYPVAAEDNSAVTIRFGGSTSVEKMAKALSAQFSPLCGNFIPSHNHTGSGDAFKHTQGSAKDDSGALDIGFLSRELELTSGENAASGTYGKICTDAIVAVVNKENTFYTKTDAASLKGIYDGTYLTWKDLPAVK